VAMKPCVLALVLVCACRAETDPAGSKLQAMSFKNSEWSEPVPLSAPINSRCQDQTPTMSRDELSLYFLSDRPGGFGNLVAATGCMDNNDLWVAHRASRNVPWETAVNLGAVVNTARNEAGPALSADGHLLFFSSDRATAGVLHDIYVSHRADPNDDLGWDEPTALGPDVNTALHEAGPFYSQSAEDGSANLYFYRGSDNGATTDIYYAPVTRDGETRGPAVLVSELSYPGRPDGFVTVRADGKEILFNSGRPLTPGGPNAFDIWVSTRQNTHDPWSPPENLGSPVNTGFAEFQPDLSHDGRTLLFIAAAPRGGLGGFDIWMSTRTVNGKVEL
jgi:WD40 repeat protein